MIGEIRDGKFRAVLLDSEVWETANPDSEIAVFLNEKFKPRGAEPKSTAVVRAAEFFEAEYYFGAGAQEAASPNIPN